MIVVAAFITTVEGKGDEWENEIKKVVPKFRREPGLITFLVHRNTDNPSRFFLFEKWKSEKALKEHFETRDYKVYRDAVADMIKDREVSIYREIVI